MAEAHVPVHAQGSSGLTCDAVCSAVLPCVAILRLLECLQICSKISDQLDKSHLKHLAVVFLEHECEVPTNLAKRFRVSNLGMHGNIIYNYMTKYSLCRLSRGLKTDTMYCRSNGTRGFLPRQCHRLESDDVQQDRSMLFNFAGGVKKRTLITVIPSLTGRGRVKISLKGNEGLMVFTIYLRSKLNNTMSIKYKTSRGKWIHKLQKDLFLFTKKPNEHFSITFNYQETHIRVSLDCKQYSVIGFAKYFKITQLQIETCRYDSSIHSEHKWLRFSLPDI